MVHMICVYIYILPFLGDYGYFPETGYLLLLEKLGFRFAFSHLHFRYQWTPRVRVDRWGGAGRSGAK